MKAQLIDHGLKERENEAFKRELRLRLFGLKVGAGQDAYFMACLFQIMRRSAGRSGHTVTYGVIAIDNKKDFHDSTYFKTTCCGTHRIRSF